MELKTALSPAVFVGFAAGLILATPLLIFFNVVSLPTGVSDTLVGAIVGASIAGIISIAGQILVINDNESRHRLADHQRDQALALSLLLKVLEILDHSTKTRNISWVCVNPSSGLSISQLNRFTGEHETLYFHTPVSNTPRDISFDHSEMALCIRLSRHELFNALKDLEGIYATLIETQAIYKRCHRQVLDHAKDLPNRTEAGRRIQAESNDLDSELAFTLSDSRAFIMEHSISSAQAAEECRLMLLSLLVEHFGLNIGMTMVDDLPGAVRPIGR